MAEHNLLGTAGETAARDYLTRKGYTIRHCNWRLHHLELDLVAETEDRLIIVEVKTRSSARWAHPLDAITNAKIKHLVNAAQGYINLFNIQKEVQFDLLALTPGPGGEFIVEHIPDAFLPPLC